MNVTQLRKVLLPFRWLVGNWYGKGKGGFPTMNKFSYENQLCFKILPQAYKQEPLIHFEEIAWVITNGKKSFKHWESGYLKPCTDGRIQLYVCHNTGRIEIAYGTCFSIDTQNKSFQIDFSSEKIRNDEGTKTMRSSTRHWVYRNQQLEYSLTMATEDTKKAHPHLHALLHMVK